MASINPGANSTAQHPHAKLVAFGDAPASAKKKAVAGGQGPLNLGGKVFYDDDDYEKELAVDNTKKKAQWKNNPFVPLGAFGGAVLLGVGFVYMRRNAGYNMSQTMMQGRVAAQAACVAGLVGFGIATHLAKDDDDE